MQKRSYGLFISFIIFFILISFEFNVEGARSRPSRELGQNAEEISLSKHNLSANWDVSKGGIDPRVVKSATETEICVFCHTPHAASNNVPLWNRDLSYQDSINYTPYQPQLNIMKGKSYKGSLNATPNRPSGYSKLCLSCHDGSIAIGNIKNAPGAGLGTVISGSSKEEKIQMMTRPDISSNWSISLDVTMPTGLGENTGYTRKLGTDLTNDHPISISLEEALQGDDEIKHPVDYTNPPEAKKTWNMAGVTKYGTRLYPKDFSGQFPQDFKYVQCTSCHNPHLSPTASPKFLRAKITNDDKGNQNNRTQICETCHVKPGWVNSTHENSNVTYRYDPTSKYPELDGATVGLRGCLNCHDPHTIQGADRLHKNGASSSGTPAIENTCFQCHIREGTLIPNLIETTKFVEDEYFNGGSNSAPDIRSVFEKNTNSDFREMYNNGSSMPLDKSWGSLDTNGIHQPVFVSIETLSQRRDDSYMAGANTEEKVLNKPPGDDFVHVECVDCHNPHQVAPQNRMRGMKGMSINGDVVGGDTNTPPSSSLEAGTYQTGSFLPYYSDDRGGNISGIPLEDPETGRFEPLVYEICLRCHGDSFAYNMPFIAKGASKGDYDLTSKETRDRGHATIGNNTNYTYEPQFGASNKAKEFNPSSRAQTRISSAPPNSYNPCNTCKTQPHNEPAPFVGSYNYFNYNTSYHPVAAPGRNGSVALYNQLKKAFNLPPGSGVEGYANSFDALTAATELSKITIQCTDCHNNSDIDIQLETQLARKELGPITGINGSGQFAPTYKRSTDKPSNLTDDIQRNPAFAQGPHGSAYPRILRGQYPTELGRADGGNVSRINPVNYPKFLCFKCHEYRILTNDNWYNTGDIPSPATDHIGTNFGGKTTGTGASWGANLHYYHLNSLNALARCHECHNNVHSNVEANNTIYGDGTGTIYEPGINEDYCNLNGCLPPDEEHDGIPDGKVDTHLLNFAPNVMGADGAFPRWYYTGSEFRCNIACKRVSTDGDPRPVSYMPGCFYNHTAHEGGSAGGICSGWT